MAATKYIKLAAAASDIRRYLSSEFVKVADSISSIVDELNPVVADLTWTAPTLLNSWVNFGLGQQVAEYTKDALGWVHIRGLVKSGALSTVIFALPVGYRPSSNMIFAVSSGNSGGGAAQTYGRLDVTPDGDVIPIAGGPDHMSLNVSFYVGP